MTTEQYIGIGLLGLVALTFIKFGIFNQIKQSWKRHQKV